jgi:hypothetical protein
MGAGSLLGAVVLLFLKVGDGRLVEAKDPKSLSTADPARA